MATCQQIISQKLNLSSKEAQKLIDEAGELVAEFGDVAARDAQIIRLKKLSKAQDISKEAEFSQFLHNYISEVAPKITGKKPDLADGVYSTLVGTNTRGDVVGSGLSVNTSYNSTFLARSQSVATELDAIDTTIIKRLGGFQNKRETLNSLLTGRADEPEFAQNVFLAMAKGTGDDESAVAAAKILTQNRKAAYADAAKKGAVLHYTDTLPVRAEPLKVTRISTEDWVNMSHLREGISDVTYARISGVSPERMKAYTPEQLQIFRKASWKRLRNELISDKPPKMEFKSPEAAYAFKEEIGSGSVLGDVMHEIEAVARSGALSERFGSNPERNLSTWLGDLKNSIKEWDELTPQQLERYKGEVGDLVTNMSPLERKKLINRLGFNKGNKLHDAYLHVSGEANRVVDPTINSIGTLLRTVSTIARLGYATLSALADVPTGALKLRQYGVPYLQGMAKGAHGMFANARKEGTLAKEIVEQFGLICDNMVAGGLSRLDSGDIGTGRAAFAQNLYFKLNMLDELTRRNKTTFMMTLANELGESSTKTFDNIFAGQQQALKNGGITPVKWDVMRKASQKASDGKPYLTAQAIEELPLKEFQPLLRSPEGRLQQKNIITHGQAATKLSEKELLAEARQKLAQNYREFMLRDMGDAVIESNTQSSVALYRDTTKGTLTGEAWRMAAQFKGFTVSFSQRVLGINTTGYGTLTGGVGGGALNQAYGVSQAISGYLAWGYLSMTAKDLAKGRSPRELNTETMIALVAQSGSAGMIGDSILSSGSAHGLIRNYAGPVFGDVAKGTHMAYSLLTGDIDNARKQLKNLATGLTPNFWWSAWATNYAVGNLLKETIAPNSVRNTEKFLRRTYGQDYMLPQNHWD